jgi:anti-anti-sigma factor
VHWLRGEVAQIMLLGEHDLASSGTLQRFIDESFDAASQLVIDLTHAEFIDSSVINTLVRASRRAKEAGVRFSLVVGGQTIVRQVLEMTEVLGALNAVESLEDALRLHLVAPDRSTRMILPCTQLEGDVAART